MFSCLFNLCPALPDVVANGSGDGNGADGCCDGRSSLSHMFGIVSFLPSNVFMHMLYIYAIYICYICYIYMLYIYFGS